jgi:hypothetical protein
MFQCFKFTSQELTFQLQFQTTHNSPQSLPSLRVSTIKVVYNNDLKWHSIELICIRNTGTCVEYCRRRQCRHLFTLQRQNMLEHEQFL